MYNLIQFLAVMMTIGLSLIASSDVNAEIYSINYEGTITNDPLSSVLKQTSGIENYAPPGVDSFGLFSAPGTNLAGVSIASLYTFDTAIGTLTQGTGFSNLVGQSPLLSLTIKINDTSYSLIKNGIPTPFYDPNPYSYLYNVSEDSRESNLTQTQFGYQYHNDVGGRITAEGGQSEIDSIGSLSLTPELIGASLTYSPSNSDDTWSYFYVNYGGSDFDFIPSTINSVTVSGLNIPEPSTWTMMLLGAATIGTLARHKRRGFKTIS